MQEFKFVIENEHNGIRLDSGVANLLCNLTRSYVKKLIDEGAIIVNGKASKASYKLVVGDELHINLPETTKPSIKPEKLLLDIVYEDDSLLIINKPVDMVVHPAAGNYTGTLVNALLYHCGNKLSTVNGVTRPGIVHRLDKDTTGLLLVAKNDDTHISLSEQLKARTIKRGYVALVHNNIIEDNGTINKMIARAPNDRKKMAVVESGGREAVTEYSVRERLGMYTLVNCYLDTGRTHQIRVHMRHIGNPIVGDKSYGVKSEEFKLMAQLLHAEKIGFIHPKTMEYMEFNIPIPANFKRILDVLRKRNNI